MKTTILTCPLWVCRHEKQGNTEFPRLFSLFKAQAVPVRAVPPGSGRGARQDVNEPAPAAAAGRWRTSLTGPGSCPGRPLFTSRNDWPNPPLVMIRTSTVCLARALPTVKTKVNNIPSGSVDTNQLVLLGNYSFCLERPGARLRLAQWAIYP